MFFFSFGKRSLHQLAILGVVMARLQTHRFEVVEDRCFGCGACIALCPVDVLFLQQRMVYVDEPNCTHCRLCIPSCPVFALRLTPL
jgi:NAD-dependent dihydropyrimidine dehydrogenase PreA subunit